MEPSRRKVIQQLASFGALGATSMLLFDSSTLSQEVFVVDLSQVEPRLSAIDAEAAGMTNTARAEVIRSHTGAIRGLWGAPVPDPAPSPDSPPPTGDIVVSSTGQLMDAVKRAGQIVVVKPGIYDIGTDRIALAAGVELVSWEAPEWANSGRVSTGVKIVGHGLGIFVSGDRNVLMGLDISGAVGDPNQGNETGAGIQNLNNAEVAYCVIHHCKSRAIGNSDGIKVHHSEWHHCGSDAFLGKSSGGFKNVTGGSSWDKPGCRVEYCLAHENIGPGIWGDRGCRFHIYEHNISWGNTRAGIRWEIGAHASTHPAEARIAYNKVYGNGDGTADRAGIRVNSANSAHIHHNEIGPNKGGLGVTVGGERHPVYGLVVENNRLVGGDKVSGSGGVFRNNTPDVTLSNVPW